jgi:hypothetical protein
MYLYCTYRLNLNNKRYFNLNIQLQSLFQILSIEVDIKLFKESEFCYWLENEFNGKIFW